MSVLTRMCRLEPYLLLVRMQSHALTLENRSLAQGK